MNFQDALSYDLTPTDLKAVKQLPYGKFEIGDHIQSYDHPCTEDADYYLLSVIEDIVMFNGFYAYKVVGISHSTYDNDEVTGEYFHVPIASTFDWDGRICEIDYDLSEVPEGYDEEYKQAIAEGYTHEEAVDSVQESYMTNDEEPPEEDPDQTPPDGWGYDNGFGWA